MIINQLPFNDNVSNDLPILMFKICSNHNKGELPLKDPMETTGSQFGRTADSRAPLASCFGRPWHSSTLADWMV